MGLKIVLGQLMHIRWMHAKKKLQPKAPPYPCDETVFQLACVIMAEHNKQMPHDLESAINLYIFLLRIIRNTL